MTSSSQPIDGKALPARDRASRTRRAPTRRRLIQAATDVAADRGYAGLNVAQVIECAGISRSTFYEHFVDLEECFLAALDCLGIDLVERLEAVEPAGPPSAGPLIEALCEFVDDDPGAARVLFMESLAAGPKGMDERERIQHRIAVLIAVTSQSGPDDEEAVPAVLETLVGGLFRLFAMRLRRNPADVASGLSPDELAAWVDSYTAVVAGPNREPAAKLLLRNARPTETYELKTLPAGRHALTEAEVDMNRRVRVYSALTSLSHEAGYAHTSVSGITAEARISRNAFYRLFHNKAEAATKGLELMLEQVIGACASAFTSGSSWPDQVWRASEAFASFFATARDYCYLGLVETHVVGDEMTQLIYERIGAFTLFLEGGYRWRPQAQGLSRISSEAIGATMYEIAFRALRERRPSEWYMESLPQFLLICLVPFMGHEAAMNFVAERSEVR
jgi:AcrR family transcriptional regulator